MTFRTQLLTIAILLTATIVHAQGRDPRVTWLYPTGSQTYFLSDVLNASYITPYLEPRIGVWCTKPNDGTHHKISEQNGNPGNGWTLIPLDRIPFPVDTCWLIVWEVKPNGDGYENGDEHSSYTNRFKVQFSKQAAVTVGLPLPTAAVPSSAAPSTSPSPASTSNGSGQPTEQPQSTNPQATGISTGAVAGIAIGAAALSLILGGLAVLFWHRNRTRGKEAVDKSSDVGRQGGSPSMSEEYLTGRHRDSRLSLYKKHAGYPPRELSDTGSCRPHELSG